MIRYFRKDRAHFNNLLQQGERLLTPEERDQVIQYISGSGRVDMKPLMETLSRTYTIKSKEVRQDKISLVEEILFIRKPKGVCAQLIKVLHGPVEPMTRGFIFGMLSTLAREEELPAIVSLLRAKQREYRDSGVEILKRMNPKAVAREILKILDGDGWYTKSDALELLNEIYPPAAVKAARMAMDSGNEYEQKQAIRILGNVGSREAVAALEEYTSSDSPRVRVLIAEALVAIGGAFAVPALVHLLKDEKREVVTVALKGLGEVEDRRVAPVIAELIHEAKDMRVQLAAIESLGRIGTQREVYALVEMVKDENLQVRQAAADSLTEISRSEETDVSEMLIELMSDPDVNVRRCVAGILGSIAEEAIFERMFQFLRDKDWWVREAIAESLANLGDKRVVEPAIDLLSDESEILRRYGIEILMGVEDIRAVDPLIRLLRDPDWWVRERTIEALGKLGDSRVVPLLIRMLAIPQLAYVVAQALGSLKDERAVRPLGRALRRGNLEVKLAVLDALNQMDASSVEEEIRSCLVDTDKDVRNRAKETLRQLDIDISEVLQVSERWWENQKLSLLDILLLETQAASGSDLFLITGMPPQIRTPDHRRSLHDKPLSEEDILQMITAVITPDQERHLRDHHDLDFSYEIPGESRFRGNIFRQANGVTAVMRLIPTRIPTMEELGLPDIAREFIQLKQGLVLVTGPAACGKSTSLAAMIQQMNSERSDHIITIEDPIEYIHPNSKCLITQRELGRHAESFHKAIWAALREDPDVILVGEMRDLETISMAITAAETGHLVLSTLHALNAAKTVDRIIDVFPTGQQAQIRTMLADSLQGVMSQQLLGRKDGKGLVPVFETLRVNSAVANLIREDKVYQIPRVIGTSRNVGMISMDQALAERVRDGDINPEQGFLHAHDKDVFIEMTGFRPDDLAAWETKAGSREER